MAKEIIANVEPYETRVAVLDSGTLVNLFIERGEPLAGNVYKGRVANVLPGMEAAFVDIGLERNAFLHVGDIRSQRLAGEEVEESFGRGAIAERLRVGQEILVQVTKEPMGSKGARVTTYVALPAYYLVLMPTVNYVGVSRRIENEQERRRLRQLADRVRPKGMGVIVRTAAEGATEKELADDIQFLL
jgi:ribonuclease G